MVAGIDEEIIVTFLYAFQIWSRIRHAYIKIAAFALKHFRRQHPIIDSHHPTQIMPSQGQNPNPLPQSFNRNRSTFNICNRIPVGRVRLLTIPSDNPHKKVPSSMM